LTVSGGLFLFVTGEGLLIRRKRISR